MLAHGTSGGRGQLCTVSWGRGEGEQPHNQRAGAQHNENCELIMAPNPLTFPQSHCECKLEMDAMSA